MRVLAGSPTNLTCTVKLNPAVDVPVNVTTEWSGPERTMFLPNKIVPAVMMNLTTYISTVTVDAARNGSYTCQATITSGGTTSGSANITVGMYLFHIMFQTLIIFLHVSMQPPFQPPLI